MHELAHAEDPGPLSDRTLKNELRWSELKSQDHRKAWNEALCALCVSTATLPSSDTHIKATRSSIAFASFWEIRMFDLI